MNLRFGIKTAQQYTSYDDILRVWLEADSIPIIEHAWAFDHFIPLGLDPTGPQLEGWTLLGALAARTEHLRVGLMVTGNTYRHPAVLAKIGATVDHISHGRLDFGIGAGWNEVESNMYDCGQKLSPILMASIISLKLHAVSRSLYKSPILLSSSGAAVSN